MPSTTDNLVTNPTTASVFNSLHKDQMSFAQLFPTLYFSFPYQLGIQTIWVIIGIVPVVVFLALVHECGHFFFGKVFDCQPKFQVFALESKIRNFISPFSIGFEDSKIASQPMWKYRLIATGGVLFEVPIGLLTYWLGATLQPGFLGSVLVIGSFFRLVTSIPFNLIPIEQLKNDGYQVFNRP